MRLSLAVCIRCAIWRSLSMPLIALWRTGRKKNLTPSPQTGEGELVDDDKSCCSVQYAQRDFEYSNERRTNFVCRFLLYGTYQRARTNSLVKSRNISC